MRPVRLDRPDGHEGRARGASSEQRAEIVGRQIREVDGVRHGQ